MVYDLSEKLKNLRMKSNSKGDFYVSNFRAKSSASALCRRYRPADVPVPGNINPQNRGFHLFGFTSIFIASGKYSAERQGKDQRKNTSQGT